MLLTGRFVLSATLILGTLSMAAAESWDPVPGDRNSNPSAGKTLFENRGLYGISMQFEALKGRAEITHVPHIGTPAHQDRLGPSSSPSIYGGGW
jgi:hypothetical protein